jgi:RNA polymerase sigma-70 factor (ECF subfamily)
LTQDIFLRAYRNLDRYRGECRFSTWLYVITRNLCVSAVQRKHAEPLTAVSPAAHDFADASADVHALVERRDRRRRQWGWIVETLDRTEARVMLLHYGEELPLRAVSRVLGLTNKSGAKAYIVSARRKLTAATHLLTRAAQCTRY